MHLIVTALVSMLPLWSTPQQDPEFEVASVKVSAPLTSPMPAEILERMSNSAGPKRDPGRIAYQGVTLKNLLCRAYQLKPHQISGPAWLTQDRYDVEAKLPSGADEKQEALMLRRLLVERFQIQSHSETRPLRTYSLKVAKGGPKLQPFKETPQYANDVERRRAVEDQLKARMAAMQRGEHTGPFRSMGLSKATLAKFADSLTPYLDGPVIDETGIEGEYSFDLRWTPDGAPIRPDAEAGPTIFAAIQEQLGLKLEPGKNGVEVLIIDKAEKKPIEN